MDNLLKLLQTAAIDALNAIWNDFAKECKESAVFVPLARYSNAAAWLAQSMALSTDCITRKLGAMLAGWIFDPKHIDLLSQMLDREREFFRNDQLSANSVAEDIMFAATRWTNAENAQIRDAGIVILLRMIQDALVGTPWNTAHWAIANLHRATGGKHEIFRDLAGVTEGKIEGQRFVQNAIRAVKEGDKPTLERLVATPSELYVLSPNHPSYLLITSLWDAAAAAQHVLQ